MSQLWVVGLDIAKDKFDVCIKHKQEHQCATIKGSTSFENNYEGFSKLWTWVMKRTTDISALRFVMEATGVYHEVSEKAIQSVNNVHNLSCPFRAWLLKLAALQCCTLVCL